MDASTWDERYAASGLVWTAEPNRFVAAETTGLPPGRALDLAAGEGRNAVWLAAHGWDTTAVDFSATGLAKGRELAAARGVDVTWLERDLTAWTPDAAAFDLVVVAYLHLPQDHMGRVLRSAARALAPGGTLVFVGHDVLNLTEGIGGPQDPAILHTPATVAGVLATVEGTVVDKAERVARPVATDDGERDAVDTLVRAHRAPSGSA